MTRVGIFGPPIARPLDFVDAFLGEDLERGRSDSEEHGGYRLVVVETSYRERGLAFSVAIPPRSGARAAFGEVLGRVDAGVLLLSAAGAAEQAPVVEALVSALADALASAERSVPLVVVVNEHLPPRLEPDPALPAPAVEAVARLRGRICWWRHEKTGTEIARAAVDALLAEVSR